MQYIFLYQLRILFMNIKFYSLFTLLFFCNCCEFSSTNERPKNVILLISDGTGLSQISSAYFYKESDVNYSRFQHIGLITTSSSIEEITDSAASGTAFSCGQKTYNGAVGVLADSTQLKNVVEIASLKGVKTGLVATSSITHATPACFYAHVSDRDYEDKIALQLTRSEIDYFAGGGEKFFNQRADGLNLIDSLESNGFTTNTNSLISFNKIKSNTKQAFLLGAEEMPKMSEGRGDFLSEATLLGVLFFQNNTPFFLMSEGSQIDWAGHDNDAPYLISELIDFDELIGAVLDFAAEDGETLVVVTSDHETGGFTLSGAPYRTNEGKIYDSYNKLDPRFSTGGHSATLIPVFAYGPGAAQFSGVYDNTDIFHKIIELTKWDMD